MNSRSKPRRAGAHPSRSACRWFCASIKARLPTPKALANTPPSIACSPPTIRFRVLMRSRATITRWARRFSSCRSWRVASCSRSAAFRARSRLSRWHFFRSSARNRGCINSIPRAQACATFRTHTRRSVTQPPTRRCSIECSRSSPIGSRPARCPACARRSISSPNARPNSAAARTRWCTWTTIRST